MTIVREIVQTIGPIGAAYILAIGIVSVTAGYLLIFGLCRISAESDARQPEVKR